MKKNTHIYVMIVLRYSNLNRVSLCLLLSNIIICVIAQLGGNSKNKD